MAFTKTDIITGQCMIPIPFGQILLSRQSIYNIFQQRKVIPSLLSQTQITFEAV